MWQNREDLWSYMQLRCCRLHTPAIKLFIKLQFMSSDGPQNTILQSQEIEIYISFYLVSFSLQELHSHAVQILTSRQRFRWMDIVLYTISNVLLHRKYINSTNKQVSVIHVTCLSAKWNKMYTLPKWPSSLSTQCHFFWTGY